MILNQLQQFQASKYNNQAVRLTSAAERSLISGHPWIFSNSILRIKSTAKTGDLCVIFNKSGKKKYLVLVYSMQIHQLELKYYQTRGV